MNPLDKYTKAKSTVQGWAAKPHLAKEHGIAVTSVSRSYLDLSVTLRITREDGQAAVLVLNDKDARILTASLVDLIPADPAKEGV